MPPSWRCTRRGRPDTTPKTPLSAPMRSSRSATVWIRQPKPGYALSSSRADQSATERSSPLPTNTAWRWFSPGSGSFDISIEIMATASRSVMTSDELDYRPSYLAAGLAALVVFCLYLVTLAPSTAMWDTSEYIAAAYTLGLPHPPGNPLFVLLGRVFSVLPIAPNVAMRINVLAALCSAVAAAMWFLITERVLVGWLPERWQRIVGACVGTAIGATAFTVWNQSV